MAGGDHDAGGGVHGCYGVAEGGGWQGTVGDLDGDAVVGDDLGGGFCEVFGLEAGVVANRDAAVGSRPRIGVRGRPRGNDVLLQFLGDGGGAGADVGKGVVITDDGAPTIGSE